jgi:hypothetical protein
LPLKPSKTNDDQRPAATSWYELSSGAFV